MSEQPSSATPVVDTDTESDTEVDAEDFAAILATTREYIRSVVVPREREIADTDALPVTEETGLPYASEVPGRMHACGHDVHSAALFAAGAMLVRSPPPGTVRLLFQPAEETGDGAARCVAQSVADALTARFAPGATTIEFSPSSPTRIKATPVGSATRRTPSRSTDPSRSSASASPAKGSSPTAPIMRTCAPRRAAASA